MTEAEWLAAVEPEPMLQHLSGKWSPRKQRLFACACCRLTRTAVRAERPRSVLETAENVADDPTHTRQLRQVRKAWLDAHDMVFAPWRWALVAASEPDWRASCADDAAAQTVRAGSRPGSEARRVAGLIREAVGNPFRPVEFAPEWRTSTVVELATRAYESRDFTLLPVLGDALMDAGCVDERVLAHCRGKGPHVRGCWVVDGILGK